MLFIVENLENAEKIEDYKNHLMSCNPTPQTLFHISTFTKLTSK